MTDWDKIYLEINYLALLINRHIRDQLKHILETDAADYEAFDKVAVETWEYVF